tara:strand:+ start:1626 stop:2438 length:813 start_codon:yes stop_codon:yes gene_type:complete
MQKIAYKFRIFKNVIVNTVRFNLWKATFRKVFQQNSNDLLTKPALDWYESEAITIPQFANENNIPIDDSVITEQMNEITKKREKDKESVQNNKQPKRIRMGGFANVPFVYSIVKEMKRKYCLECGVSMGASSYAILKALDQNKEGILLSNDLPYLWNSDPVSKIGMLVPDDLKKRWKLYIGDDIDNLSEMLKEIKLIDFAHYDSNKSYKARSFFWDALNPHLTNDSLIVFDDIIDNNHFYDLANNLDDSWKSYVIFDDLKYIGILKNHDA